MNSLDNIVKELDKAVNDKDLEKVLSFYEKDSILVMEPGRVAKGKAEIGQFFKYIFNMDIQAEQITTNVMQTGDIVLFTSKWTAKGKTPDGTTFNNNHIATSVFRKNADGVWRLVIDNSFGPEILNE